MVRAGSKGISAFALSISCMPNLVVEIIVVAPCFVEIVGNFLACL